MGHGDPADRAKIDSISCIAVYRRGAFRSMVIETARSLGPIKENHMAHGFKDVAPEPWSLTTKITVGISVALAAVLVIVLYV